MRATSPLSSLKNPALTLLFGLGLSATFFSNLHAQEIMTAPDSSGSVPATPASVPTPLSPEKSAVEVSVGHGALNGGYGDAGSYSMRGMETLPLGVLQAEVVNQSRFGFTGNYGGLSLTKDLSPDYYTIIGAGAGSSLLFPSWRTDVTGYKKMGDKRQYVVGIGAYYAKGNEALRSDAGLIFSGIYYANNMVFEGGLRFNQANPGSVLGPSQYIAATFGSDDRRAIVVRLERAKEAYQVLTTGIEKVDFISNSIDVQWRERITPQGMLIAGVGYYNSPNYDRTSFNLGWRWSFR